MSPLPSCGYGKSLIFHYTQLAVSLKLLSALNPDGYRTILLLCSIKVWRDTGHNINAIFPTCTGV